MSISCAFRFTLPNGDLFSLQVRRQRERIPARIRLPPSRPRLSPTPSPNSSSTRLPLATDNKKPNKLDKANKFSPIISYLA
ncbi:UNVERIFIED_CONTAM: hypothetical protein GTU68_013764 [Idotea baltica]|nr:hypothetical protein [Idotea baltica]